MEFDKVIMNPPYDKSLHLKVLNEVLNHSSNIVNLSPIRWLKDPLADYKDSSEKHRFKNIVNHIDSLDEITAKDATDLFGAGFTSDLGIYKLDNNLHNFTKYDNTDKEIITKVIKSNYLSIPMVAYSKDAKNFCVLKGIDGSFHIGRGKCGDGIILRPVEIYGNYFIDGKSDNGLTLEECYANNVRATKGSVDSMEIVEFNTSNEAINFSNSVKTIFYRWYHYTTYTTPVVQYKFFPYMKDYTKPWLDEDFIRIFCITNDEWSYIKERVKYYESTGEDY